MGGSFGGCCELPTSSKELGRRQPAGLRGGSREEGGWPNAQVRLRAGQGMTGKVDAEGRECGPVAGGTGNATGLLIGGQQDLAQPMATRS